MTQVAPLPPVGDLFFDERDDERILRLSWHQELDTFVISLWRHSACVGTFRLHVSDVPRLVRALNAPAADVLNSSSHRAVG